MIRGRTSPQAASVFINEMGTDGVTTEDLTTKQPLSRPRRGQERHGGFYSDVEERGIIEAAQDESPLPPEYEYITEGCLVRHPKFGLGKVMKLAQRWPETRATIHFESFGPKKIVLRMTTLELVSTDHQ